MDAVAVFILVNWSNLLMHLAHFVTLFCSCQILQNFLIFYSISFTHLATITIYTIGVWNKKQERKNWFIYREGNERSELSHEF